jgi:hypothetical protein
MLQNTVSCAESHTRRKLAIERLQYVHSQDHSMASVVVVAATAERRCFPIADHVHDRLFAAAQAVCLNPDALAGAGAVRTRRRSKVNIADRHQVIAEPVQTASVINEIVQAILVFCALRVNAEIIPGRQFRQQDLRARAFCISHGFPKAHQITQFGQQRHQRSLFCKDSESVETKRTQ